MKKRIRLTMIIVFVTMITAFAVITAYAEEISTPIVTEPTTQTSTAIPIPKTNIIFVAKKTLLYVNQSYTIKVKTINGSGKIIFTSSNEKVATVGKENGAIKALKKGKAVITATNNNTKASFTLDVLNPKVNISKTKGKVIPLGTTFKINVTGQARTLKFKSSKPNVIRTTKDGKLKAIKPGKVLITIKTNGLTIKRKVKSKIKLKIKYVAKKNITLNVGQTKKIRNLYTYKTNKNSLQPYLSNAKWNKLLNKIETKAENPKASSNKKNIVTCGSVNINPKNKGNAVIIIKCGKQKFRIPITITKKLDTTYKGKKAKYAYNINEAYKLIKEAFNKYAIKGNRPDFLYIVIGFDEKVEKIEDKLYNIRINDFDSPDNFCSLATQLYCDYEVHKDKNNTRYIDVDFYNTKELADLKKLYNTAQDIFKSLNLDSFTENYEKLIALSYWFNTKTTYSLGNYKYDDNEDETFGNIKEVLYERIGYCAIFAETTNYLCSLLNIPSINTNLMSDSDHEWNLVKLDDKWYHYEPRTCMMFYGNKDIKTLAETRNPDYKMSKTLYYGKWDKRVSDDSIILYMSKLKEVAEKCGITTDKTGKNKIWNRGFDNIIDDME